MSGRCHLKGILPPLQVLVLAVSCHIRESCIYCWIHIFRTYRKSLQFFMWSVLCRILWLFGTSRFTHILQGYFSGIGGIRVCESPRKIYQQIWCNYMWIKRDTAAVSYEIYLHTVMNKGGCIYILFTKLNICSIHPDCEIYNIHI